MTDHYERFALTKVTPALWRVAFNNPPINLIDARMVGEFQRVLTDIERDPQVAVLVLESANPDYFLAHWDLEDAPENTAALPAGPTGLHPWLDLLIRLSRLPIVTIAAVRGRARGAGSELALASDIRFASRERAILGQFELGSGAVPGGGPSSRLPRLVGRGRALEILLSSSDYDGDLAERYGYVNRAIPDAEFEQFIDDFATRVSHFDVRAIQEIKSYVNAVTLPPDDEFPPQMAAFWNSVSRPETQDRVGQLFALGLQRESDAERDLGAYLDKVVPPKSTGREQK
jgi:enoyl-CoA hydratase/carnithine racemase